MDIRMVTVGYTIVATSHVSSDCSWISVCESRHPSDAASAQVFIGVRKLQFISMGCLWRSF